MFLILVSNQSKKSKIFLLVIECMSKTHTSHTFHFSWVSSAHQISSWPHHIFLCQQRPRTWKYCIVKLLEDQLLSGAMLFSVNLIYHQINSLHVKRELLLKCPPTNVYIPGEFQGFWWFNSIHLCCIKGQYTLGTIWCSLNKHSEKVNVWTGV